jgi:hypothetical protein
MTTPKPKRDAVRSARYAEGGDDKMVRPQAAGPARPGTTGKVPTPAPGAKSATGGSKLPRNVHVSAPAKPGRTGGARGR